MLDQKYHGILFKQIVQFKNSCDVRAFFDINKNRNVKRKVTFTIYHIYLNANAITHLRYVFLISQFIIIERFDIRG